MNETLMAILNDICGAEEGELEPTTALFEEGMLDSFGMIELFVEVEKQLGVKLEPTELTREELGTPARIAAEIAKRAS